MELSQIKNIELRNLVRRYSLPLPIPVKSMVTTGALMSHTLWSSKY